MDEKGYLRFSRYYGGNYVSTAIFFVRLSRGAYPVVALDVDIQILALASSYRKYYTRNILIIVLKLTIEIRIVVWLFKEK